MICGLNNILTKPINNNDKIVTAAAAFIHPAIRRQAFAYSQNSGLDYQLNRATGLSGCLGWGLG